MAEQRYIIHEQLGVGGSGAVYRAYDSQLKRWVAIKRLLSVEEAAVEDVSMDELRREADTLASMRNSSIVTIYDVGTDEEGLFIVMELLTGPDLSNTLAHSPLGLDDFKQLAEQTLEALLAAHELRILHRDIKPENIKVERLPGGRLQAKIIDFGLARKGLTARKQTESGGTVMGSIYYMAPEQLSRKPTDQRTDLYSLGCVLYESLSGRKAFDGKTVNEVIDKHLNDEFIPLATVCPHLPQWLIYWVCRLMAREPENRPQNAQQAIEEFRAWEKLPPNPNAGQLGGYGPAYNYPTHVVTTTHAQPLVVYHTTGHHPSNITGYQTPTLATPQLTTGHIIQAQPVLQQPYPAQSSSTAPLNQKKKGRSR
jgi:serine/threonine protein kinase